MAQESTSAAAGGLARRSWNSAWLWSVAGRARNRWFLLGLVGAAASIIVTVVWLLLHRRRFVGDTDELGYLSAAWDDSQGLRQDGLRGLWWAYLSHIGFGPLVPVVTVPIQLLTHDSLGASVGVEIGFLIVLLVAAAVIGHRLGGPIAAALGVIAVAGTPAVIDYSRSYQFALAATAMLTAAVAAMLLTDRMRRTGWVIAWGFLLGLTLLSRTMTIALVPGPIAAGLLLAVLSEKDRWRRLSNWAAGLVVMLGVAATWYVSAFSNVLDYLTTFGYGSRSGNYGTKLSPLSWSFWSDKPRLAAQSFLDLPLSVLILSGAAVGLAFTVQRLRSGGQWRVLTERRAAALAIWVVIVEGYLALSSSSNEGNGFEVPLIPITLVIAIAALVRIASLRLLTVAAVCAIAALNLVAKSGAVSSLADEPRDGWMGIPLVNGVSLLDGTLRAFEPEVATSDGRLELGRQWIPTAAGLDDKLTRFAVSHGRAPRVAMGTRDPMLDTNSMTLACHYVFSARSIPFQQLDGQTYGDTAPAYVRELSDPMFMTNLLVIGDIGPAEFKPVNSPVAEEFAATQAGFTEQFQFGLPDGRTYRVWWRDIGPPAQYDPNDVECHS